MESKEYPGLHLAYLFAMLLHGEENPILCKHDIISEVDICP